GMDPVRSQAQVLRRGARRTRMLGPLVLAAGGWWAGDVGGADLGAVPALGLRVARGVQVTLFADANLAGDNYSLTLGSRGNVVVSGPGYIRTLLDDNGDGAADRGVDFAKTPSGSMGMAFDGPDLLFVGDGALWRFRDTNGDGQADGEPERLLGLRSAE